MQFKDFLKFDNFVVFCRDSRVIRFIGGKEEEKKWVAQDFHGN